MNAVAAQMRHIRLGGVALTVDDDQPTFWDRVETGRWEPGTIAVLSTFLGPDAVFLDLGAWVGPLALLASARGARVIAVEADPAAQDQLRRNLAANPDLTRRVEIVRAAVSPDATPVRLGARRKPGDSMSSILLAGGGSSWIAQSVTPVMLAERVGQASRLVVKIDIEGGEYALLPHLRSLLDRPRTAVLVSFHPAILCEAGEPEPERRLREAVAIFGGWDAAPVTPDGLGASSPLEASDFGLGGTDTWLFRRR